MIERVVGIIKGGGIGSKNGIGIRKCGVCGKNIGNERRGNKGNGVNNGFFVADL
ncbi:hypothetical protein [Staphylococcus epidermidis]|uniref:hypothetical protein n=1 Tax=Staphylococcus epidermidis TaxID=1282 RepID=UPI0016433208|nr:hypothetical protein [Staphylococcus epidermidis]